MKTYNFQAEEAKQETQKSNNKSHHHKDRVSLSGQAEKALSRRYVRSFAPLGSGFLGGQETKCGALARGGKDKGAGCVWSRFPVQGQDELKPSSQKQEKPTISRFVPTPSPDLDEQDKPKPPTLGEDKLMP